MIMKKVIFLVACIGILSVPGCYYDKTDALFPYPTPCDSTGVISYTDQVTPILSGYCLSCHSSSNAAGGIKLDTYTSVFNLAQSGKLLGALHRQAGFKAMPPSGSLNDCMIRTIEKWVDAGAPNT